MNLSLHYSIKNRKLFKIMGENTILASTSKLWEIITTPGHLTLYHPFCQTHEKSTNWAGVGGTDISSFYNGKIVVREVTEWHEGIGYSIKMLDKSTNKIHVRFQIIEQTANISVFSVTISSDAYRNVPRPIWYFFAYFYLVPSYKKYLTSLLKGLAWYSETGQIVVKNQFGSHRQFSP